MGGQAEPPSAVPGAARTDGGEPLPRRRRRRAVGPAGARPGEEPDLGMLPPAAHVPAEDDERLRREVPPHHGG